MEENNQCAPKAGATPSTMPTEALSPSQMHGLLAAGRAGATAPRQRWNPPPVEELQQALPQYEISAFAAISINPDTPVKAQKKDKQKPTAARQTARIGPYVGSTLQRAAA